MCLICLVVVQLVANRGEVRADQLEDLQKQVDTQSKQINLLKQDVHLLRSSQRLQERLVTEMMAEVTPPSEDTTYELPQGLKWLEKTQVSADLRYRLESINDDRKPGYGAEPRNRNCIRFRVNVSTPLSDEWTLTSRFATGSGDPRSTNITLDDGFSKKQFNLDQAFMTYTPVQIHGLTCFAGKMASPFYAAGDNQLVWDKDITPEGGAATYSLPISEETLIHMGVGGFWVVERSAYVDTGLWAGQASIRQVVGEPSALRVGTSYYDYTNIRKRPALATEWDAGASATSFFGNSNDGSNLYANDYDLWEVFAEFQSETSGIPVSVFGTWVQNQGTEPGYNGDTGWLVGATCNKTKEPGSWQFTYNYRDVEADAVLAQFTESDFLGGDTGGKGHFFSFVYQVTEVFKAAVNYYDCQQGQTYYNRVQLDLMINMK
jgi:hypothetical protein